MGEDRGEEYCCTHRTLSRVFSGVESPRDGSGVWEWCWTFLCGECLQAREGEGDGGGIVDGVVEEAAS